MRNNIFRWVVWSVIAAGLWGSMHGCGRQPVAVGFLGSLSGKYADLGTQGRNGVTLAVEEINRAGGILGREVVIVAEDDVGTPEGARDALIRLKRAGVTAVIGPMLSSCAFAIKPLIDDARLPAVSPTVSTAWLTGERDFFFRVVMDNAKVAPEFARFALRTLPPPRRPPRLWCAVYDVANTAYASSFTNIFAQVLNEAGDLMACRIGYSAGGKVVPQEVFRQVEAVKPDALLMVSSAVDGAQIVNRMSEGLPDTPVFAAGWAATGAFLERLVWKNVPLFAESSDAPEISREAEDFRERYYGRFGKTPFFPAFYGYEAMQVLAEGMRRSGGDPAKLPEALASIRAYPGLLSPITMDGFGDAWRGVWVYTVKDGGFRVVAAISALQRP